MSRRRLYGVAVVVALQVVFFAGWAAREMTLRASSEARVIRVRTLPVDPRDLISGRYLTLRYEIGDLYRFRNYGGANSGDDKVWAVLRKDGEFYAPDTVSANRPWSVAEGSVLVKGNLRGGAIEYGVEKYFIPETQTEPPRGAKITVDLRVLGDHTVRIERLNVTEVPAQGTSQGTVPEAPSAASQPPR